MSDGDVGKAMCTAGLACSCSPNICAVCAPGKTLAELHSLLAGTSTRTMAAVRVCAAAHDCQEGGHCHEADGTSGGGGWQGQGQTCLLFATAQAGHLRRRRERERGRIRVVSTRIVLVGVVGHELRGAVKVAGSPGHVEEAPVLREDVRGMVHAVLEVTCAVWHLHLVRLACEVELGGQDAHGHALLDLTLEGANVLEVAGELDVVLLCLGVRRHPPVLHGSHVVPLGLQLRLEVPEEPTAARVIRVELLVRQLAHHVVVVGP
mmetsp:Transcript_15586/g.41859  ORF Transcript_15586/g.41859 Transcript_15586/m.41859 type:complete len:263 (-) Transcript_15586:1402-2190(-)